MTTHEFVTFFSSWDAEAKKTAQLLRALPANQYDFRPDPEGRTLGQLAWHLAEIEGYMSSGVAAGKFDFNAKIQVSSGPGPWRISLPVTSASTRPRSPGCAT